MGPWGSRQRLVVDFHLNPASCHLRIFIDALTKADDTTLWMLAISGFIYASLRLCEAVGLWHQRRWAEWLGMVRGGLYVPIKLYALLSGGNLAQASPTFCEPRLCRFSRPRLAPACASRDSTRTSDFGLKPMRYTHEGIHVIGGTRYAEVADRLKLPVMRELKHDAGVGIHQQGGMGGGFGVEKPGM
jgi:hypothetical protein